MKKVAVKIPAKINLTLDVLGTNENYHEISSLVASIDIYDEIIVSKRSDYKIKLTMKGLSVDCAMVDNNAYKAAVLFQKTFKTGGVDIVINKNIPVAGGLGGSSADIAGVLKALNLLFSVDGDMEKLASELGSDAPYMLKSGYAVLSGRGEKIERLPFTQTLYLLLITENASISARSCYKKFDQRKKEYQPTTAKAVTALNDCDEKSLIDAIKNDLSNAACELVKQIKFNLYALNKAGVDKAIVAGSGPTVLGFYSDKKDRDRAYKKLVPLYGDSLIKAKTTL